MTAWRDVEVAAAEALDGPTDEDLEAIRAATFTVEAVKEREKVTDHDVAAFVDVLAASAGPAGRWIHFGLTSSDVLDTALALQLQRPARSSCPPPASTPPRSPSRRARTPTRCASAAPTACTPSRRRSGSSSPGSRRRRHRNAERLEPRSTRRRPGRSPAPSAPTPRSGRSSSGACSTGSELASRAGLDPGRAARPPRRAAAARSRSPAPGWSASRRRSATSSAPRSARSRSRSARARRARARCRTSATRSRRSGSAGLARVLRGYAQTGLENVALWHERDISHSGAERVVLPDATILLDYMQSLALRVVRGMVVHDGPDAGQPRAHARRAVLPARAARAGRARHAARRRLPARPAARAAGVGHAARRCGRCSSARRASTSTSTPCSTTPTTFATCPKCLAGWRLILDA